MNLTLRSPLNSGITLNMSLGYPKTLSAVHLFWIKIEASWPSSDSAISSIFSSVIYTAREFPSYSRFYTSWTVSPFSYDTLLSLVDFWRRSLVVACGLESSRWKLLSLLLFLSEGSLISSDLSESIIKHIRLYKLSMFIWSRSMHGTRCFKIS